MYIYVCDLISKMDLVSQKLLDQTLTFNCLPFRKSIKFGIQNELFIDKGLGTKCRD